MGAAIIQAITDGLGVITALGEALNDGFNAVFVSGTALTNVGVFAFILN